MNVINTNSKNCQNPLKNFFPATWVAKALTLSTCGPETNNVLRLALSNLHN